MATPTAGKSSQPIDSDIETAIGQARFSEAARRLLEPPVGSVPASAIERIAKGLADDAEASRFLWALFEAHPTALPVRLLERRLTLRGDVAGAEKAIARGLAKLPNELSLLVASAKLLVRREAFLEASALLRRVLELSPGHLDAKAIRALVNASCGELELGLAELYAVEELSPELATPTLAGLILYSETNSPREVLSLLLRRAAQIEATTPEMEPRPILERPQRLKIGYLSADFRQHSVAYFIEPILRCHDRRRFDIHAYHTRPGGDEITRRIAALDIGFHDVSALDNHQLAMRIREDEIDVLVDLGGHTEHSRIEVFARRPAPVQVTYLGYAATTGLQGTDARLTDAVADPIGISDELHSEQLVRLPGCAWCFAPPLESPEVATRSSKPITFGSFNALMKVGPSVVRLWASIMERAPGSRLFLKAAALSRSDAVERVTKSFAELGISSQRLVLKGWESEGFAHLDSYGSVDIALDPFPYNGTTTTCEALWMGVPVITLEGDRHSARVGSSLLTTIGMSDWVARSPQAYVGIAVSLSQSPKRLREHRKTLRQRLLDSPLCDGESFTRNLELSYDDLFARRVTGTLGEIDMQSATRSLHLAREASDADEIALAGHFARRALATLPGHIDLAMLVARADEVSRNLARGERALARAVEIAASSHFSTPLSGGDDNPLASAMSLGQALRELARIRGLLGKPDEQRDALERWVSLEPASPEAHVELGTMLRNAGLTSEARAELELAPTHPRALMLAGILEMSWGRPEPGLALLERAVLADPSDAVASSNLLYGHQFGPSSREEGFRRHLLHGVRHARTDASLMVATRSASTNKAVGNRKLRIGYLSADLREHSIARFIEGILRHHDRDRFHVTLYAAVRDVDETTSRLEALVDQARFVYDLSDREIASVIAADGVEVLVELGGHTAKSRIAVMAHRPARAQVSYLGYPDTTGLPAIDYKLTDEIADPTGDSDPYHVERLLRLESGAWCFDARPSTPPVRARPPGHAVVFGSFNDIAKVTDSVLGVWATILKRVAGSRLLLKSKFAADKQVVERARSVFEGLGICEDRVELRYGSRDVLVHLETYGEIDIALDPFPYCGTTTTCEALDMGVPVVSLSGDRHVSRVGKSLLSRVGLADLATETVEEYVDRAAELARNGARRAELRETLRDTFRGSIGNSERFTKELENKLRYIFEQSADAAGHLPQTQASEAQKERARALVAEAASALATKQLERAEVLARQAIANHPSSPETHNVLGNTLVARGEDRAAETAYRRALVFDSKFHKAYNNIGNLLAKQGDRAAAITMFERAISIEPSAPRAYANLANAQRALGRTGEATLNYERALALGPNPNLSPRLAENLSDTGDLPGALKALEKALPSAPGDGALVKALERAKSRSRDRGPRDDSHLAVSGDQTELSAIEKLLAGGRYGEALKALAKSNLSSVARHNLAGRAFIGIGDSDSAKKAFEEAVALDANDHRPLTNLGNLMRSRGELAEAIGYYQSALSINPDAVRALVGMGQSLHELGRLEEAAQALEQARRIDPASSSAAVRLSRVLAVLRGEEAAEKLLDSALLARPNDGLLAAEIGSRLHAAGRVEEATPFLERAEVLLPSSAPLLATLGDNLRRRGEITRATALLQRAISIDPRLGDAHLSLAFVFGETGRHAELEEHFAVAESLGAASATARSIRLYYLLHSDRETQGSLRDAHRAAVENFPRELERSGWSPPPRPTVESGRQRALRIGYASPDFRLHVVGLFMEEALRAHDRSKVEIELISWGPPPDEVTRRFASLGTLHDVRGKSDTELVKLLRQLDLDVLVDLAGHTRHSKLAVFAERVATVQASYLGYPSTTGVPAIDWHITDERTDPEGAEGEFVERLYRLPEPLWSYAPWAAVKAEPSAYPANKVVFGCFNRREKIGRSLLGAWKEILEARPEARLHLKAKAYRDRGVCNYVLNELGFAARDRVTFEAWVASPRDNYEAYREIDVALDTYPYNGTTTTCDALWMGVPVVTWRGRTSASRVGATLLETVGLERAIATDRASYVATALRLADDVVGRRNLRQELREVMRASPLCDARRLARQLEEAFRFMLEDATRRSG